MLVRMQNNRNSLHALLVGLQNGAAILEDSLMVSYKTKHTLFIQSSDHSPWYLLKGVKNTKTCTWMFIAALFPIDKTWKQPRLPFSRWVNKLWYIQIIEYCSVLKSNKLPSYEKPWKNVKCILLSERSQSEKAMYCMISTILHSWKAKLWRQ